MLRIKHIIEEGEELDIIRDLFREYEKELNGKYLLSELRRRAEGPIKKIRTATR